MTGKRVWWYFVAFFGFVAGVNAIMVTLALHTNSGLVTEHAYEKGLAYNQVVKAEQQQEEQGWQSTITLRHLPETANTTGFLTFMLKDKNNNPITPEKIIATFTRPTQEGMDFTLELKSAETKLEFPAPGQWDVRIDADYQSMHFQKTERIVVQ